MVITVVVVRSVMITDVEIVETFFIYKLSLKQNQ